LTYRPQVDVEAFDKDFGEEPVCVELARELRYSRFVKHELEVAKCLRPRPVLDLGDDVGKDKERL